MYSTQKSQKAYGSVVLVPIQLSVQFPNERSQPTPGLNHRLFCFLFFLIEICLKAEIYCQWEVGVNLKIISWNRLLQMTQFHIQEPLQFVRTSLKCSVKYLKISAYIVRSIAHFHNALIKAFIYPNLLSPSHKWFLLSEDEYLGLYLIIFYSWVKKTQTTTTKPYLFFLLGSHSHVPHLCAASALLIISLCFPKITPERG